MKKLLKPKDILLLTLAGIADMAQEVKDPLHIVSAAYESVYGFVPRSYKKHNFVQMMQRSLKTGDIEKIVRDDTVYIRITSKGKKKIIRDFPVLQLTKQWNKRWLMLIFDIEEESRIIRDRLRRKLKRLGFGMLQESVWVTPLPLQDDMREVVASTGLAAQVFVFEVTHLLEGDPKELVRRVWNLEHVEQTYGKLKESLQIVQTRFREMALDASGENSKQERVHLELEYVRLKRKLLLFFADFPLLPQELLPLSLQSCLKEKNSLLKL